MTRRNQRGLGYALTQELIDRTERRMDWFILAAYAEQFQQSGPSESCPHCGGSGKIPTAGKPLPAPQGWDSVASGTEIAT